VGDVKSKEEKVLSLPEAKTLVEKRRKDGALGYEQQNTAAYFDEFVSIDEKDAREMRSELGKLGFLSDAQAASVVNNMPRFENEVRAVLAGGEKSGCTPEQAKSVLKIVKDYAPKK
jgi:DNA-directed RNA polymerase subunit F